MRIASRLKAAFCALLILAVLLIQGNPVPLRAQSDWPPPTILWQAEPGADLYTNNATNLVTDSAGWVHLAWLNFPTEVGPVGDQVVIYYSRWDGQEWTTPVDIFAGTGAEPLGGPVLLPAQDGRLHILWISSVYLMHSVAWAADAARPQAWSPPAVAAAFSQPLFASFDAAVDASGRFHAVFAERPGNLYYIWSDDQGETWSHPAVVSDVLPGMTAYVPQVAVASNGRIHVVWSEASPDDDTRTCRVYYAFSADGGNSWAEPREFGGPAHSDANVAAFDDDKVYVAWNAGAATSGGRYLRYSADAGVTWSDTLEFSKRAGLSNYPSIVEDSLGRVHLLTGDGEYAMWDGTRFSPAEPLSPVAIQTERCRLTVAAGNTLVAVFPPDDGSVYTAVRRLAAPSLPVQTPLPAPAGETPQPTAGAPPVAAAGATAPPGPRQTPGSGSSAPPASGSTTFPLLAGAGSALVVVLLAAIISLARRKR